MEQFLKRGTKIFFGLFMLTTVIAGYYPIPENFIEFTCITNLLGGLVLMSDGLFNLNKKLNFTPIIYRTVCVSLMIVFIVCMVSLTGAYSMNFYDAFLFMHAVNPICFFVLYLGICDENNSDVRNIFLTPTIFMLYLLFDYIFGKHRGSFVYGFFDVERTGIADAVMLAVIAYFVSLMLSFAIFHINQKLNDENE